jgi:hypothetical protein
MKRWITTSVVSLACSGIALPTSLFAAPGADGSHPLPAATDAASPMVTDVALQDGGAFVGQVVDQQGLPVRGVTVQIRQEDREVAGAVTDTDGQFRVSGLHGGVYQVVAGQTSTVYRLWAPQTAPPAARPAALLVSGQDVVRGQAGGLGWAAVCGAAAGGVAAVPFMHHSAS